MIKQFEIGPMKNFGYLIGDEKTKQAWLVDPAWSINGLLNTVEKEGYKLAGFVITHAHYDHTNAIEDLLERVDVPVYAHKDEITYSKTGNSIVGSLGRTAKPVQGGDSVKLGETEIKFLHTPGHTPGSQCLQVGNDLITGDTLFIGGCGRSDMPGGDPKVLFQTLKKIASLPPTLRILPGHDYGVVRERTLKEEIEDNPYLQMQDAEEFLKSVG